MSSIDQQFRIMSHLSYYYPPHNPAKNGYLDLPSVDTLMVESPLFLHPDEVEACVIWLGKRIVTLPSYRGSCSLDQITRLFVQVLYADTQRQSFSYNDRMAALDCLPHLQKWYATTDELIDKNPWLRVCQVMREVIAPILHSLWDFFWIMPFGSPENYYVSDNVRRLIHEDDEIVQCPARKWCLAVTKKTWLAAPDDKQLPNPSENPDDSALILHLPHSKQTLYLLEDLSPLFYASREE